VTNQDSLDIYASAWSRWSRIIQSDDKNYRVPWFRTPFDFPDPDMLCPCFANSTRIDDIYICGKEEEIDGPFGVLGSASPFWRIGNLPITGSMRFDSADVATLIEDGRWEAVALHEMGHVLGLGSRWNSLKDEKDDGSVDFNGTNAQKVWQDDWGCTGLPPIERDGGAGTAGGHWDEATLDNELMTGWINSGTSNPLSNLTIAALQDQGYSQVDYGQADFYDYTTLQNKNCCSGSRRALRGGNNAARPPHRAVSSSSLARAKAVDYGKQKLNNQKLPDGVPREKNGATYVGDQFVQVLYIEDDGSIQDVVVTPND